MEPAPPSEVTDERRFPCTQCGATLVFAPGTSSLSCAHCGRRNAIVAGDAAIRELDYRSYLSALQAEGEKQEQTLIKCGSCGAEVTKAPEILALACPWCGADIVTRARSRPLLEPRSLLPFTVTRTAALAAYRRWVQKLWWAPGDLARSARLETGLKGIYLPYWTYDAETSSSYTGQRGDHYWMTETYTATGSDGKPETRTRQVRRTRWTSVSGHVEDRFDDILVAASKSAPAKLMARLTPWDLENLVPYADEYLAGFAAESYQLDLADGFAEAREVMERKIRESARKDIGGDEQRVESVDTAFLDITFKYLLLPIWIGAWRYRGQVYRSLVNARTGEVQAERPYSRAKIILAILIVVLAVGAVIAAFKIGG